MSSQSLTVLFADLADSTRLYQMQGDTKAHRAVSESLQCMREAIESHDGKLLRTVGDASLASFDSTDAACEASIQMQRAHLRLGLQVKIGFHYGHVIPDDGDVYGNAVNLAARVADYAEANEICTTEQALSRLSLQHRTNVHYLDKVEFKGIDEPMPVYRVHWRTDSASTVIVAPVPKIQRALPDAALMLSVNGQTLRLDVNNPKATIGRAVENDVVIESDSASRRHASIELTRGKFVLSDASTNGTFLVKKGQALDVVKRETVALDQQGLIGLGADPRILRDTAIDYRLEAVTE